ncbi:DNA mismatch repair protein MutS [Treponema sp. OMZ 792]|uniref:DNA mismatch repair protein MutS n=1 Tax=unclassified Treponema TaxID=2638727 RepID=UPI0020A5CD5D|nr:MULTISPECIES: DNA mismatch repair protein MutS [unclassified Treponema]UTC76452.1 DNA mismatch repair protein MutS [Treponema sp. OMZ 792]UTC81637.1 DNA mismatch repair protein MutS [Treponema sp. OMZ 798]
MMRQYLSIKAQYKDEILFFRLGDFYEMFFDEAVEVSRILNLTLTKRADVPMCGIPYHAAKIYIARLLRAGKKIAICEQVTEPVAGGLTERKVVEVITPGTVAEDDFLEQGSNNYLAAVYCSNKKTEGTCGLDYYAGLAYIDVTTGNFFATSFPKTDFKEQFLKEIGRINPKEILIQQSLQSEFPGLKQILSEFPSMMQNFYPDWSFNPDQAEKRLCAAFGTENLKGFLLDIDSPEVPPAGLLLQYLEEISGRDISHISGIKIYAESDFVSLDDSTRKNLELLTNLRDNSPAYSLFESVNYTKTAMGTRLLRRRISYPLRSKKEIDKRLDKVNSLFKDGKASAVIRETLSSILDIERLSGRIAMKKTHGKDLLALKQSLNSVIRMGSLIEEKKLNFLQINDEEKKLLTEICNLLENSIDDECTIALNDGKLIKKGFSKKVDSIKNIKENAHGILEKYLDDERKKTGINNLKIKYNRMMGYFLEVSLGNISAVPDYFIRQRSLSNADRFTTETLQQIEDNINNSEERLIDAEKEVFDEVCAEIGSHHRFLQKLAEEVAELDVNQSFAQAAILHAWTRPELCDNSGILNITNGRHPVVENHLRAGDFVPNSIELLSGEASNQEDRTIPSFAVITGPNMAGKSTFLRQTALICLLAQIGSFVPAEKAVLSPVDKIFCRVGATDNLARGESTFLVEMIETAYILNSATRNSLVIMDEVGRGTSMEDGLAIAQAVSEHLLNIIKAKTLFATHYHELTRLEHEKIINLKLDVLEAEGKIVFLKKVVPGAAGNSYGIHVAGLAGIPQSVLTRAENLLYMRSQFQKERAGQAASPSGITAVGSEEKTASSPVSKGLSLFPEEELILNEILSTNPDETAPIKALQLIASWKNRLSGK